MNNNLKVSAKVKKKKREYKVGERYELVILFVDKKIGTNVSRYPNKKTALEKLQTVLFDIEKADILDLKTGEIYECIESTKEKEEGAE